MKLQLARRFVQGVSLTAVGFFALLSLYAHYRAAGVVDDAQLMAGMQGEAIIHFIHPLVEWLDDPQALIDGNKGTLWSARVMGLDVSDPLAAAEMLAASKHVHWPLLISVILPIVLTLLLGKVFCSWICPGYVLFELTGKLRKVLRIAEIQPGEVRFSHNNKYIFLVVGLAVAAMTSFPLFALIYPPAVISRVIHAWIFGTALTGMVVLLLVIVAVEVFVSPRWWCRTMCPGGALYGLFAVKRLVRVTLKRELCTGCLDCVPVCEAGINPITQSTEIECDNCGVCLRHCGDHALQFTIGLPIAKRKNNGEQRRNIAKAAVWCVLIAPLVFVSPAAAHHILGLPHYSYKENYPQRPTLEYPATTGPYDVLLTSYPGIPVPSEAANLAFYIKNRDTHRVYDVPVTVRILQTSTFGDNTIILPSTTREPFDNQYKFHVTFPDDGEYIVELSMEVEGRMEVIPFLMVVGAPNSIASFILVGALGSVMCFVVVRAVHIKRKRHRDCGSGRSLTVLAGGAKDCGKR